MERPDPAWQTLEHLDLDGLPEGEVLAPLHPWSDAEEEAFRGWETPLAPRGGFRLPSALSVAKQDGRNVLWFNRGSERVERALVWKEPFRDGRITATFKPGAEQAKPHNDRADVTEALAGVVFRVETSRRYYQFGIEGRHRVVLCRRCDDEWIALAEIPVDRVAEPVTVDVLLDGDAIHCRCPALDVTFFVTDTAYRRGKAGFRALGEAALTRLTLEQTPAQTARDERWRQRQQAAIGARAVSVPDAVKIAELDIAALGGTPTFVDIVEEGCTNLLVACDDRLRALSADGKECLWEFPERVTHTVFAQSCTPDEGRLIFACAGVRREREQVNVSGRRNPLTISRDVVVLRGRDGKVLARRPMPEFPEDTRQPDFAPQGARFTSDDGTDIVLREWRDKLGGGGRRLWAFDRNLEPLWEYEQPRAWYGHHWALQLCDVDGDGRDELLAGGTLYDADGEVLWEHDRMEEMARIPGAQHYDAVVLDHIAGDDESDPVAMLLGGSAGLYVVDGITGKTRAVHRIGHAQGRYVGRFRTDLPGKQVLAATRWGNMGILTLLSGRGERLWSMQPDYVGQGACPVTWPGAEAQLIWTNTSRANLAFFNGFGENVCTLSALQQVWGDRMRLAVTPQVVRLGKNPQDCLSLTCDGRMHIFAPAR